MPLYAFWIWFFHTYLLLYSPKPTHTIVSLFGSLKFNKHTHKKKYGHEIDILIQYYERELLNFQSAIEALRLVTINQSEKIRENLCYQRTKWKDLWPIFSTLYVLCAV